MNYSIVKNESRKTLTVVLSPVLFNYTKYLYERFNNEKFFATGVLDVQDYNESILPFAKELVVHLNELAKGILPAHESFAVSDIITLKDDEYRLITKNTDRDGTWDKRFKINLSSKTKSETKKFLFKSLDMNSDISEEDSKKYIYGVEIEIGAGYNEDNMEKYIYTVFHRAVAVKEREQTNTNNYKSNDQAWVGFNFDTEDTPF
jgi:hypothetical protein